MKDITENPMMMKLLPDFNRLLNKSALAINPDKNRWMELEAKKFDHRILYPSLINRKFINDGIFTYGKMSETYTADYKYVTEVLKIIFKEFKRLYKNKNNDFTYKHGWKVFRRLTTLFEVAQKMFSACDVEFGRDFTDAVRNAYNTRTFRYLENEFVIESLSDFRTSAYDD